eukprot:c53702_g1_i1.p1 GENE.c53702_g1_i1~~c53702_g1_i1.p1  ORF type:complete len:203 (+),score=39.00 c53702_g1_i1:40-648(+)
MEEAAPDHIFKVLLIGDAGVGKSSILLRFVDNTFSESIGSTIGVDFKAKIMTIQGQRIKLTIWDTAGQERFRTLTSSYYRGCQAIILVYDCSSRESFERLNGWLKEVELYATVNNPVKMLVANKVDKQDVQVDKDEGSQFARSKGMMFIQCSAKTKVGIHQAFEEVVQKILDDPTLLVNTAPARTVGVASPQPQAGGWCCWT